MRDYAIAPTAQRLAEENNVDWRVLTGSGEGGSVVERDVLGYLARVMRGEEATNPTPEPLPEGLSAWPEEPERRRSGLGRDTRAASPAETVKRPAEQPAPEITGDFATPFTAPFTAPRPVTVVKPNSEAEAHTPWTVEKPAKAALETPVTESEFPQPGPLATEPGMPPAQFEAQPEPDVPAPAAASPKEDASEAYRAALAELEALQTRVGELEDERSKHVNELHQLSRMQETIALQKNEGAKLGALQSEVRDLKAQLAAAQRAAERVETLAEHNRDLEARLVRARTFKAKAKTEFERILEDNMMLEHELADLKKARRGLFRKG